MTRSNFLLALTLIGCGSTSTSVDGALLDGGRPSDAAAVRDGSAEHDSGTRSDGGTDPGTVTHPPACPEEVVCTEPGAECTAGGCAITCVNFMGTLAGLADDCSAFGTCVESTSVAGPIAVCEGDGWFDACDATYEARCEGNVAFRCDGSTVRLSYCDTDALCWAEDSRAGCHTEVGACNSVGNGCRGGEFSNPCCDDYACERGICVAGAGDECNYITDCSVGLACRREDGEPPGRDETGTCVAVTCVMGHAALTDRERCDHLPDVPCCEAGMVCGAFDEGAACCLPTGAEPLNESGAYDGGRCCNGFTEETFRCL